MPVDIDGLKLVQFNPPLQDNSRGTPWDTVP